MNKKIIVISIVSIVVLAGGVVAVLWLFNQNKAPAAIKDPNLTQQYVPDLSEDYGACNLFTKDEIKLAIGSIADNLGNAINSGRIFSMGGSKTQHCTYVFDPSSVTSGNFRAEITIYKDQSDLDAIFAFRETDKSSTSVQGLGAHAVFYETLVTDIASQQFSLVTYNGLNQYTLTITQPKDKVTFSTDQAMTALKTLAGQMKT